MRKPQRYILPVTYMPPMEGRHYNLTNGQTACGATVLTVGLITINLRMVTCKACLAAIAKINDDNADCRKVEPQR